jgi:hypothetical protein
VGALAQGETHRDREVRNLLFGFFCTTLRHQAPGTSFLANVFESSCHREDTTLDRDEDVAAEAEVARGEMASFSCEKGALNAGCTWPGRDGDKSQKSLEASSQHMRDD